MGLVDKIGQCADAEVLRQCRRCTFCVCERQATELFIAIGEDENRLRVLDLNPVDLSAVDAESAGQGSSQGMLCWECPHVQPGLVKRMASALSTY